MRAVTLKRRHRLPGTIAVCCAGGVVFWTLLWAEVTRSEEIIEGKVLASDDFDRFTTSSEDLGTLSDGVHRWGKRLPGQDDAPQTQHILGLAGKIVIAYRSSAAPRDTGVYVSDLNVADAVIELAAGPSRIKGRNHRVCVNYRAQTTASAAGGWQKDAYHLEICPDFSGSRDVLLRYGREVLAAADVAAARRGEDVHKLRVAFVGDRHFAWLDGKKVIDYWEIEPGRNRAGQVGFGGAYSSGDFDDFKLAEATLAAAAEMPTTTGGQIAPLVFQGRRLFVLGTFDPPAEEDVQQWLGAGGNTVLFAVPGVAASAEDRAKSINKNAAWAARCGVAAVYYPLGSLFSKKDGHQTVTSARERPAKIKYLKEMLAITARHPQTLGYWTFDEPENHLYQAYGRWKTSRERGLGPWMVKGLRWTYDTLKAGHPDAYVMPTIAWWSTYEHLAPLYDVNVPNSYPTHPKDPPLTGPLYHVVLDARKAAEAVRAAGRTSFIYMPGIFDNISGDWRPATQRELRYLSFAPITQGAMGIFAWRLGRCSPRYRQAVVYPVMRQLDRLIPWFLGEWCDKKLSSNHDAATAEYLKKLPVRVKTVTGEKAAETAAGLYVGDCSYMLRRRPSNSYLLLAVSNRKEPIRVTFTLGDIGELPEEALESLEYRKVAIRDNRIEDTFEPFGVRAYLIEPK